MQLTLNIDISNNKAKAFIAFIKTLDFINIENTSKVEENLDEYSLSSEQIAELKRRKQLHIDGKSKSYNWEDIKEELDNI